MDEIAISKHETGINNGLNIVTFSADEFSGEYDKRSIFYFGFILLASLLAMVTNLSQIFFIKVFRKPKDPFYKILWELGRDPNHVSSFVCDRFSRYNHKAKYGAASWQALDLFYNYHEKVLPKLDNNLEGFLTRLWIGKLENRQAVKNRLKILIDLLSKAIINLSHKEEIRILSIASGSAQAVIEAIKKCQQFKIKAVMLDIDLSAIDESKRNVKAYEFNESFSFICGSSSRLEEICNEFKPHIIEMVGFLDYRPKSKAIRLISRIKECLPNDGIFLTSNIRKNREKIFLDWLLLWPLIYRNENKFGELLITGGFSPDKISIFYEPFRIHGIAVCKK